MDHTIEVCKNLKQDHREGASALPTQAPSGPSVPQLKQASEEAHWGLVLLLAPAETRDQMLPEKL